MTQLNRQESSSECSAARANGESAPRILHVVSSVELGGIEMWLLHLLRYIDRQRFPMDALVLNDRRGPLESELRSLGCRVFYCPNHRKPWLLRRHMTEVLRHCGPYDVVHSHVHYFSGAIVRVAAKQGVPIRVVHSRNDTRVLESESGSLRRIYTQLMKRWIQLYATDRIAISIPAAEDLFGAKWRDNGCAIVYSGRDFSPFTRGESAREVRQSLGLPSDALVLGHVGRFHRRKNHALVIEVATEVIRRTPKARLLLVGDGAQEGEVRDHVRIAGIGDRVVFAGARDDVPRLLRYAMDVFLFPSHHEGLGVVAVEAQAAGLPCIIADHLPAEIDVVPDLIQRLSLSRPPAEWASAVLRAANGSPTDPAEALRVVLATDFNIERSVANMARIYDTLRSRCHDPGAG